MSDLWMPSVRLKCSAEEFAQLPRHPAYKYEYSQGVAHLSPWPRYYHARLELASFDGKNDGKVAMRHARPEDFDPLVPLFVTAFAHLQPFGSLPATQARFAAEQALQRTFSGGDGPIVPEASFVALVRDQLAGALFITLLPGGDPQNRESYHWENHAPADLWVRVAGQPHLTWIFVDRLAQGGGIGTRLLRESTAVLRRRGYAELWTTFLVGNDSSLLWHWRNGFELFPHFTSKRSE
jgi:GNAT superfamily N-acetyltransferase